MAECRVGGGGGDCLIKLFGKTIPVPEVADVAVGEADKQRKLLVAVYSKVVQDLAA
ncbi:Dof-type zinc finger protein 06 [Panicum miliaceum]|uniref:Dof-type zinc finger protein 06 n=1 Tax=Panicum miliaceum TaxID=4540 RepID=A0A3L6TNP2_PANMI|nr:Dof-type zinc finger protein 06 [Panicum miliaceum]